MLYTRTKTRSSIHSRTYTQATSTLFPRALPTERAAAHIHTLSLVSTPSLQVVYTCAEQSSSSSSTQQGVSRRHARAARWPLGYTPRTWCAASSSSPTWASASARSRRRRPAAGTPTLTTTRAVVMGLSQPSRPATRLIGTRTAGTDTSRATSIRIIRTASPPARPTTDITMT